MQLFLAAFKLLLAQLDNLVELLALVLVGVWQTTNVHVVVLQEVAYLLAEDLLDPGQPEQEERVCNLPQIQLVEAEDKGELVLLVVPQERHKGVLALVNYVLIDQHLRLHLLLDILVQPCLGGLVF